MMVPFKLEVNSIDEEGNIIYGNNTQPLKVLAPSRVWNDFQTIITLTGNIVHLGYRPENKMKIFFSTFPKHQGNSAYARYLWLHMPDIFGISWLSSIVSILVYTCNLEFYFVTQPMIEVSTLVKMQLMIYPFSFVQI